MADRAPALSIVVSQASFDSSDPYDVIESNISFVNALYAEHFRLREISADALESYYVDYFLAQIRNGGFSQFVYNSRWKDGVVSRVREGLRAIGAQRHAELFERAAEEVASLGDEGLQRFLAGEYFGEDADRDRLGVHDSAFFALEDTEDLVALNAAWIRGRPDLRVLTIDEMRAEVARRAAAIPDREARVAQARAAEPRYLKLVRRLCDAAGHVLDRVTAGDPSHVHEGARTLAWHFLTDRGHFYMVEAGGVATMLDGSSHARVAAVDAPEEP